MPMHDEGTVGLLRDAVRRTTGDMEFGYAAASCLLGTLAAMGVILLRCPDRGLLDDLLDGGRESCVRDAELWPERTGRGRLDREQVALADDLLRQLRRKGVD